MREATGTVYGDIGTSVLYTLMEMTRETIRLKRPGIDESQVTALIERGGRLLTDREAIGGLSLVFWALVFLTVKYDLFVMRADNRGEGGTFALWALLKSYSGKIVGITLLGYLVVAAAGLLAADGVITPPISLLGAFEPLGEPLAVGATLLSLFSLFKAISGNQTSIMNQPKKPPTLLVPRHCGLKRLKRLMRVTPTARGPSERQAPQQAVGADPSAAKYLSQQLAV